MSAAARKLAALPPSRERVRKGPPNQCASIYAPDPEDADAIEAFRLRRGESWATAQTKFDELLGVTTRITNDKFRYHWNRRCFCWPDDLRRA